MNAVAQKPLTAVTGQCGLAGSFVGSLGRPQCHPGCAHGVRVLSQAHWLVAEPRLTCRRPCACALGPQRL